MKKYQADLIGVSLSLVAMALIIESKTTNKKAVAIFKRHCRQMKKELLEI